MTSFNEKLKKFAVDLFKVNAIKFGEFKTKIGLTTPVYCDLRVIVSYPKMLDTLAELLVEYTKHFTKYDVVCGVPYTALPIATTFSLKTGTPMVMRRKEPKDYGTKRLIEGNYRENDQCLIIEDVVTSGGSILETVKDLVDSGLQCTDAIVLLNREQGGEKILRDKGITMHALLSLSELMGILRQGDHIDTATVRKVDDYLKNSQIDHSILNKEDINRLTLSFETRAKYAKNPVAAKLFKLMATKKTNLCVAVDVTVGADLLNIAERVGPYICLLKTHIDLLEDFHPSLINHLKDIAKRHNFILFEDRKFADIGKIVELQYSKGIFSISSWAELVTAHSLTGPGVLDAIKQADANAEKGVFVLAETSAAGSLIDDNYTKTTVRMAVQYADLIAGIVCQKPLFVDTAGFIQLTPGVQLDAAKDNLGQQYNSPEYVVKEKGADIAVVGRGITKAANVAAAAEKYKQLLWDAYLKRIQ